MTNQRHPTILVKGSLWRGFASDNYAGVHPEVLKRMVLVNDGHEIAYGDDTETASFNQLVK